MSRLLTISNSRGRLGARAALGIATIACLLAAGSAFAQAVDIPALIAPNRDGPKTAAMLGYAHQFKVDVDNANQELARHNAYFGLSHRIDATEKTSVTLIANYTLQAYDFSGGTNGGPGRPTDYYQWDDVHRLLVGAIFGYDVNERWRIIYGAMIRSWGERGAHFGKSLTAGAIGGFDYHPSEDFSVGLMIGAFSSLEDEARLIPIPTLKWNFAEDWRLNVGMVRVADPGVGAELDWQITDEVGIGLGGAFQSRRFRLKDSARVFQRVGPGRDDAGGVGEETQFPVYGIVRWKPAPKMAIDLQAGVSLAGHLQVENNRGGRIHDDDYDIAPFLSLKGTYAF